MSDDTSLDAQLKDCKKNQKLEEPNMLVFAQCKSDMVKIPYSKATIEKTSLGYIVVVGDFFIILVFISFTNILEKS